MQKTGTSENLPRVLPKQQLESFLWEFNSTGELSLPCCNISLTIIVNVGSVRYHCSWLFRNERKMQNVDPDLDLEFKCCRATGCLDLGFWSQRYQQRLKSRYVHSFAFGFGSVLRQHILKFAKFEHNLMELSSSWAVAPWGWWGLHFYNETPKAFIGPGFLWLCCHHHRHSKMPTPLCSLSHTPRMKQIGQQGRGASMLQMWFFWGKGPTGFVQHNKSKQVTGELVFFPNIMIVIITVI